MRILLSAWLLLETALAQGAALDFARGAVIASGDGLLAGRVILTRDVYEWVARADLGDVRVLNDAGEEVPYALSRPRSKGEHTPWLAQPVFALPGTTIGTRAGAEVNVEVDDKGAVIAIRGEQTPAAPAGAVLVDSSAFDGRPTELRLDWESPGADFVGRIRVEASDDLNSWRTLADSVAVASLAAAGQRVRVDRVDLPGVAARYLKITQVEGSQTLDITTAELRSRRAQLPERRWKTLEGQRADGGFEFSSGGRFPLDRIALEGSQDTYLVAARLLSRSAPDQPWQPRGSHTFYRTVIDGIQAASDPVAVAGPDQQWRVEIDGDPALEPRLRIGWLPDELAFLAQGSGPFLLAYGRAGLEGRQWPVQDLLDRLGQQTLLDELPPASLGEPMMLGGPERLTTPPEPVDWQTVVLWSVLVLGVLLVGGFALRLLKG